MRGELTKMRPHIAIRLALLLVNITYVTGKELPAIVTYTVSPSEVPVSRKGNTRAAIESDSLASELVQVPIHPTASLCKRCFRSSSPYFS